MLGLELPERGRHVAGDLIGQIDSRLLREAERGRVFGDGVDTEAIGERVVEGVAGVGDGVVDVDHAVVPVATKEVPVEGGSAVAWDVHGLGDVLLETGDGHDDFEGAAGGELGLDALVKERMVGIVKDLIPVIFGEANGKLVGIEGGTRGHGENLACVRVHGDDSADFAFENFFGGHLDVEIDGELEVFAGGGEFLAEVAEFFAVAIDDDVATAVYAAEKGVVGGLDAGAADDVAGRVEGVAVIVGEHLLGDLADVANEVSGEAVGGIEAALLVEGFEFGEFVAVSGDESLFVGRDVLLKRNRLVLRGDLVVTNGGLD